MGQESLVIPGREVRALVSPARLRSIPGAEDDRFGNIQHEGQL
jgi:hypothetical protein